MRGVWRPMPALWHKGLLRCILTSRPYLRLDSVPDFILIVDFGSQVTDAIGRPAVRYAVAEPRPSRWRAKRFSPPEAKGHILPGSPAGVLDEGSPRAGACCFLRQGSDPRHLLRPTGREPPTRR
jgi:hypothetical protein